MIWHMTNVEKSGFEEHLYNHSLFADTIVRTATERNADYAAWKGHKEGVMVLIQLHSQNPPVLTLHITPRVEIGIWVDISYLLIIMKNVLHIVRSAEIEFKWLILMYKMTTGSALIPPIPLNRPCGAQSEQNHSSFNSHSPFLAGEVIFQTLYDQHHLKKTTAKNLLSEHLIWKCWMCRFKGIVYTKMNIQFSLVVTNLYKLLCLIQHWERYLEKCL